MKPTHRVRQGSRLPAILRVKFVCIAILLLTLFTFPLFAQKHGMGSKYPISLIPSQPDDRKVLDPGIAAPGAANTVCSLQPFPGMQTTVSVASLQIPAKAQKEYDKACSDLRNHKLSAAEKHLVNATQIFPGYVAGWVMLGQVFDSLNQLSQAREACSRATAADSHYLPAYLCLAEIAGHQQNWSDVLGFTDSALQLDPANDAYAYFFSAIAYFNLDNLPEAESRALKAAGIDKSHNQPFIQFLLSQIYEAKNDAAAAASYAEQYRKLTAVPDATTNSKAAQNTAQPVH